MKQAGHYGTALLFYSQIAMVLLGRGEGGLALFGGLLAISLAMAPDCDTAVPFVTHRGVTHTLWFALLVGAIVGAASWMVGSRLGVGAARPLGWFAFLVGTMAVISHLLADVITPMGIRPLWPFSERHVTFDLVLAKNWTANALLFVAGTTATLLVVAATWNG